MEEIDEDNILAGLSAEELQQLQKEMDDIAPDQTVPVGMRQNNTSVEAKTQGFLFLLSRNIVPPYFLPIFPQAVIFAPDPLNNFMLFDD